MPTDTNRLDEILATLEPIQLQYLSVRPFVRYDKEAADIIGVNNATVSKWKNKADVDEAVRLMALDGVHVAMEILRRSTPKAAQELASELDHKNVSVRHKAATEILDRNMGKAIQKQDITSGGGPITFRVIYDDD